jgi:hypothetical protein
MCVDGVEMEYTNIERVMNKLDLPNCWKIEAGRHSPQPHFQGPSTPPFIQAPT